MSLKNWNDPSIVNETDPEGQGTKVCSFNPDGKLVNLNLSQLGGIGAPITYTPEINFGGGSTGVTYTNQQGVYIDFGRMIWLNFSMVVSNKGSDTGELRSDLPVLKDTTGNFPQFFTGQLLLYGTNGITEGTNYIAVTTGTTQYIRFEEITQDTNIPNTISDSDLDTSFTISASLFYIKSD